MDPGPSGTRPDRPPGGRALTGLRAAGPEADRPEEVSERGRTAPVPVTGCRAARSARASR